MKTDHSRQIAFILILFVSLTILMPGCDGSGDPNDPNSIKYVKVTVATSGGGTVQPGSGSYAKGVTQSFVATPAEGYRFARWEGDIESNSNPLTISISSALSITAVFIPLTQNTAPKAFDVAVTTPVNTPVNITLSAFDEDGDSIALTAGSPAHGTLASHMPTVTYTPSNNYVGPDSFTYKANDGIDDSNIATVNINVVNPAAIGWAKSFGSTSDDVVRSIAVDSTGNIYFTGHFTGVVDFDPGSSTVLYQSAGKTDLFLAKFSSNGTFQWVRTLGSKYNDSGSAVVVDGTGNIYVTGSFGGTALFSSVGENAPSLASNGGTDVLILKYNSVGDLLWAESIGGVGDDKGTSVAVDPVGNVLVSGVFYQTVDFDPSDADENLTSAGLSDGFIIKLSAQGEYLWVLTFGGTTDDEVTAVACDSNYNILVAGNFTGTMNLDPAGKTNSKTSSGGSDGFLCKFQQNGQFLWGRSFGGPLDDRILTMTCNSFGNALLGGYFQQTVDFNPDAGSEDNHTSSGDYDAFVSAINATGNFQWARTFGGTGREMVKALALDAASDVFAVGTFSGVVDFNFGSDTDTKAPTGSTDGFLIRVSGSGNYSYVVPVGGAMEDSANAVAVTQNTWLVYWGGAFQSSADLDPRASSEVHTAFGSNDAFLIKMTSNGGW